MAMLGNLILKINTYGIEIGMKSTSITLEMLAKPLFSPLMWSSYPESSVSHFILNVTVFFVVVSIAFWIRSFAKLAGSFVLVLFLIAMSVWYYVYLLSYAV